MRIALTTALLFSVATSSYAAGDYYYGIGLGQGTYRQDNSTDFLYGDSKLIVGRYLWPALMVEAQLALPGSASGKIDVVDVNLQVDNYLAFTLRGKLPLGSSMKGRERMALLGSLGFTRMQTTTKDSTTSTSGLEYSLTYGLGVEAPLTQGSAISLEYASNIAGQSQGHSYNYTTFFTGIRFNY